MWRNAKLEVYKKVLLEKQNQIVDHVFSLTDSHSLNGDPPLIVYLVRFNTNNKSNFLAFTLTHASTLQLKIENNIK